MAIIKTGDKRVELADNTAIRDVCEELGVPFGCRSGLCGTCMVDVVEGEQNLSELTDEEKDMNRDRKRRLACQATIKTGEIKIKFTEE